ncbi:hypothetical protein P8936_05525 [Edaphobacter paludis]|uniref:Uncharacterized protein n=1 Tax=Edaphobacter paludis TaxID=3035702 RepID=A0AAU7DA63_9BACT
MNEIDQLIASMKEQALTPIAFAELAFDVAHATRIALSRISPEFDKLYLAELERLRASKHVVLVPDPQETSETFSQATQAK